METKIARLMKVDAPMKMYEMTPSYYGAAIIAVTTGQNFLDLIKMYGDDVSDYDQVQGNESKVMILPGIDLGEGVAISKGMGAFVEGTIEEALAEEGYVILDIG
jgi:hypothetical protein